MMTCGIDGKFIEVQRAILVIVGGSVVVMRTVGMTVGRLISVPVMRRIKAQAHRAVAIVVMVLDHHRPEHCPHKGYCCDKYCDTTFHIDCKSSKFLAIFSNFVAKLIHTMNSIELILINITGNDRPGVTSALTDILARYDAQILDIGQADIHHYLSLGILIKTNPSVSGEIMKEMLFKAYEMNVKVRFTPIDTPEYDAWVKAQGKDRWIITTLGRRLTARHIALVSDVIAEQGLNIDSIQRLTGRMPLDDDEVPQSKSCIEFSVRGNPASRQQMQARFMEISATEGFDISLQEDNVFRRCRRLVCFDMDSTLIGTECIDQLAERAGVGEQVRAITEQAMRGEIDFCESFKRRVALLKGLDESVMREIAESLPITEGAERMMRVLKRTGYKTAILSGGFTYFGNYLKQKLGFDYVYANNLEIVDGKLTGRYLGDIVDGRRKAEMLRLIAQFENIDIEQTIAVGDGANDLPMLTTAGLGIAFHAKPRVKANAKQSISTIGIDGVLYFIGFKDSYITEAGEHTGDTGTNLVQAL